MIMACVENHWSSYFLIDYTCCSLFHSYFNSVAVVPRVADIPFVNCKFPFAFIVSLFTRNLPEAVMYFPRQWKHFETDCSWVKGHEFYIVHRRPLVRIFISLFLRTIFPISEKDSTPQTLTSS